MKLTFVDLHLPSVCLGLLGALSAVGCSRGSPQTPPKPPPPPLEYVGEWGVRGDAPGQLREPVALTVDAVGDVYLADRSTRFVNKFDGEGHPRLAFEEDIAHRPLGIAVDRGGGIYVSYAESRQILLCAPDGERFRRFGRGPAGLHAAPGRMSVDEDGDVFVAEPTAQRIEKLSPSGHLLKAWGNRRDDPESLGEPADVAAGADGFLYVADSKDSRVVKFTRDGEFVSVWNFPGDLSAGTPRLEAIAVSERYVFAAGGSAPRVEVWTLDGQHKVTLDLTGRVQGGEGAPLALAVSPRGELLVLDPARAGVLRFRINI